ncbi:GPW/gp25 family protein [soil metagenome]
MSQIPGGDRPNDEASSFIGKGFSWPFGVDHTGSIALTRGAADLDRSIELVLMTAPGERLMRPLFGCRIWELLFEPITDGLLGLMNAYVRSALSQWEPRIVVDDVSAAPTEAYSSLVNISIAYTVRATNDRRNLVYPFYVIPHDAE